MSWFCKNLLKETRGQFISFPLGWRALFSGQDMETATSMEDPLEEEMAAHSYAHLGNPMGREAWRATVHGVAKSWT